ncbi:MULTISPECIES: hypothetical protein [unclassified Paenibacillus]|uniref:Uncharacterized protein n=1 Tax=Paenibacillus provencensis TaxID=441151 RepID=A0ABW3Q0Z6_9BACL|nr:MULTISPECIES: hypothetical protein [unclassified Paenibacillus]MCM3130189.1 hypothetical protein [Paenibacillus sp. MER 78]SDX71357.1 hypothetical protein SAMN05518848_11281 [Paenibacillus sp. PDC88]SFS88677.1 hypothetical protein SAMN04488601_10677 [Paenibacillus sp. 453mf]
MYPIYDISTGLFVIEWYERKGKKVTPVRHYFEQKPLKLQIHPADPELFIRIHLSGKMPGWIKDYCNVKDHVFQYEEITFGSEQGWLLTNWRGHKLGFTPLAAPNLNEALRKLADKIPSVCPELKQQLIDHSDIAVKNLINYHEIFNNIGVYYRPEEITGLEGCLAIDNTFFPVKSSGVSDEDFRAHLDNDGRLHTMVRELINPLPDPEVNSTDGLAFTSTSVEEEEELLGNPEEEEELLGDLEEEEELLGDLEEEEELLGDLEEEEELLGDLEEEEELVGDLENEDDSLGEIRLKNDDSEENDAVHSFGKGQQPELSPDAEVQLTSEKTQSHQFVVLEYNDKRTGIVGGQMSIF